MGSDVLVVGIFDGEGVDMLWGGADADESMHLRGEKDKKYKKDKGKSGKIGKHGNHVKMGKQVKNGMSPNDLVTFIA